MHSLHSSSPTGQSGTAPAPRTTSAHVAAGVHHGSAADFLYEKKSTRDSEQHAESLVNWDQTYDQMSPGPFVGQVVEMWFKGIQIFRETTNRSVHQTGSPWRNCHIIGIPVAMSGPGLFARQQVSLDTVFTFQSEQGFALTTPEEFDVIGIAIPDETLLQLADTTETENFRQLLPAAPAVLQPCRDKLDELRRCLISVLDPSHFQPELLRYPQVQRNMHSAIVGHIQETLRSAQPAPMPTPSFKARSHVVHEAVELTLAEASEPPTVEELCCRLNISRRMLNYCFQEALGTSPLQYLRNLRLNGVRRDLRRPSPQAPAIRDIAGRWGFGHLPRFAAEYRALFGELPSATLREQHYPG